MNNKTIIISTVSFLLVSFIFLSWSEKKQADINSKNIWMSYFTNPKDKSLDFAIENHSSNTDFSYQILQDKNIIQEDKVSVSKGETKNIPLQSENKTGKITVLVQIDNQKKEIYKTL